MVRSLDLAKLRVEMDGWLVRPPVNLRKTLLDWANAHAVELV
jgi:phosphotransferase system enzyme I (PtsP)